MRLVKYGVLCGLIAAESFGTVKSKEAVAAQEAVQKVSPIFNDNLFQVF